MKIAFLACPATLPGSPSRRLDAFEHDLLFEALDQGLAGRAELRAIDWQAPLAELTKFDVAYLGTPWDYTEHKDAFLARLDALEAAGVKLCNPAEVVRWNADKLYLRELAQHGAASIPTLWPEAPDEHNVAAAFEQFGCNRVVVKRRVGAGAIGQENFTKGDPKLAGWQMDQPAMIQPFLPAIQTEGELSFIFVAGQFSHALIKRASAGDYRIQSLYGGTEVSLHPSPADRAAATGVMVMLPFARPPVYARIDMVRLEDGTLAVIEAELTEPYLYPLQGPRFGAMLAAAVLRSSG